MFNENKHKNIYFLSEKTQIFVIYKCKISIINLSKNIK